MVGDDLSTSFNAAAPDAAFSVLTRGQDVGDEPGAHLIRRSPADLRVVYAMHHATLTTSNC